jgi:hypothetical protein
MLWLSGIVLKRRLGRWWRSNNLYLHTSLPPSYCNFFAFHNSGLAPYHMVLSQKLRRTMTLHHSFERARWGMQNPSNLCGMCTTLLQSQGKTCKGIWCPCEIPWNWNDSWHVCFEVFFLSPHLGALFAHRWFINHVFCILKIDWKVIQRRGLW